MTPFGRCGRSTVPDVMVLVGARTAEEWEISGPAARFRDVAHAAGWRTWTTYALAAVPAGARLPGGRPRAEAEMVATIAVRLRRGDEIGFAVWRNGRFDCAAILGRGLLGLRDLTAYVKGDQAAPG
jgi:hypothetical protein